MSSFELEHGFFFGFRFSWIVFRPPVVNIGHYCIIDMSALYYYMYIWAK